MRTGLEAFVVDQLSLVAGKRVGFCCNHTAVDRRLVHGIDLLQGAGVNLVRLFGPEHGVRATAQDMEGVAERIDLVSGLPVISLYGDDAASLHPRSSTLEDVDVVVFDIQDIGARYYTYQATLGFLMQVAAKTNTRVVVLDRPNPINGVTLEGNIVNPGFESFVGAFPIAVRHAMTVGELSRYFQKFLGIDCEVEVVRCDGWDRTWWYDQTGLPWVYPSPNMPTLDTATVYPGMCLIEATKVSEGRGTTRPFHLVGAPWVDPNALVTRCRVVAEDAGLEGVLFRPSAFNPGFQKYAGEACGGVEVHVTDRRALNSLLLGMVVTEACYTLGGDQFEWRTEPYEFVSDVPAIDLLTGSSEYREALEAGRSTAPLIDSWREQLQAFDERRRQVLLY